MRSVSRRQVPDHALSLTHFTLNSSPCFFNLPSVAILLGAWPVISSVVQSISCESICRRLLSPDRRNLSGMVVPASKALIAGAFNTGDLKPPNVAAVHAAGRSKAATPSVRTSELP